MNMTPTLKHLLAAIAVVWLISIILAMCFGVQRKTIWQRLRGLFIKSGFTSVVIGLLGGGIIGNTGWALLGTAIGLPGVLLFGVMGFFVSFSAFAFLHVLRGSSKYTIIPSVLALVTGGAMLVSIGLTIAYLYMTKQTEHTIRTVLPTFYALVTNYYPSATVNQNGDSLTANYNVRTFAVHEMRSNGWGDIVMETGPNVSGIWLRVFSTNSQYVALSPQGNSVDVDRMYFRERRFSVFATNFGVQLLAEVRYPTDADAGFLSGFDGLVSSMACVPNNIAATKLPEKYDKLLRLMDAKRNEVIQRKSLQ
jgi:hypothetical protein